MSSVDNKFELPLGESSEKYPVGIVTWRLPERPGREMFGSFYFASVAGHFSYRVIRFLRVQIEESISRRTGMPT